MSSIKKHFDSLVNIIVVILVAMLFYACIKQQNTQETPTSANTIKKRYSEQELTQFERIEESCKAVEEKFGSGSKLTDAQKEIEWEKYKNRFFKWKLRVTEVKSNDEGYLVQFLCSNSDSFLTDVSIQYPASERDLVINFQKDSFYETFGVLTGYSNYIGLEAIAIPMNKNDQ